jgi:hypothetical protein
MLAVYDTDFWFGIFYAFSALHVARMLWKIASMWRRWQLENEAVDMDVELAERREGGKDRGDEGKVS